MPKLSFVVPTKNRVAWIGECLVSMMEQTDPDIEIIVVNDGSNDGTKEFLDDWAVKDPRVKVIHNEESIGAGKSRNLGASVASSDIICVMDDDDVAIQDRAEVTIRWFNEHPESEMVNFPHMRIGYFGEHLKPFWGTEFNEEEFKKTGNISYFSNPSCAYRKSSAEQMGGYPSETKSMTDDFQFVKNWIESGKKIDFDNRAFVTYHRVMPESIMAKMRGWKPEWTIAKEA